MKYWKIAILLMLLASAAACTVEKHSGLEIITLSCMQEDAPKDGESASYQAEGAFDSLLSWYYGYDGGYTITLFIKNTLTSSVNTEFMQGEGNVYDVKQLELEYVVPEGWDEIEGISIPLAFTSGPGDTAMFELLNIIPGSVRDAIDANYAKNAYKELQPYALLRPSVTDGNGNPIVCTPATADKKCNGYKCITDDSSKMNEKDAPGVCANTCTISSGCAQVCGADGVSCTSSFNSCDIGASDFGICRDSCIANEQCTPLKDPASGDVLIEYTCMNEMCIPNSKLVNPHIPQPIIVKMKLSGENADGGSITSNTHSFRLDVGRGNLLRMDQQVPYCCCIFQGGCAYNGVGDVDEATSACMYYSIRQDTPVNCALTYNCFKHFCAEIDPATDCNQQL